VIDLEAIKARCEAATPGPWEIKDRGHFAYMSGPRHVGVGGRWLPADAAFISHAREDVPALIAEVERLRAEVARRKDDDAGAE